MFMGYGLGYARKTVTIVTTVTGIAKWRLWFTIEKSENNDATESAKSE